MQTIDQQRRLFRRPAQFGSFLTRTGAKRVPRIDFSSRQLLLAQPGARSSSGYAIDVLGATEKEDGITVEVRERSRRHSPTMSSRTYVPVPADQPPAGKDVFVDWAGR